MKTYNWQQKDWPRFKYDTTAVQSMLYEYERRNGLAKGVSDSLVSDLQVQQILHLMVEEAMKTSEIEGVYLSRKDVMSSMQKKLGLTPAPMKKRDKKAQGISDMLFDARESYKTQLSHNQIFSWHTLLMADAKDVRIGSYRTHDEPMQVVSGAMGKEKIHFEAPPSSVVPAEMDKFITWFNDTAPGGVHEIHSGPIRSAIAHLYFETIHPFEDGNGRIGRAIAEKVLAQHLNHPVLFSLSSAIESQKDQYYLALEKAQRSNDISNWITYFVSTILQAQESSLQQINFTLQKAKFFDAHREQLNDRQLKVVNRMLEAGSSGFEGGMNATKYMHITTTSKATATRDLQDLVEKNVFVPRSGGGRSTSYDLKLV